MKLIDNFPHITANALVSRFVPPPRFAAVSFDNFQPNRDFPSQQRAKTELENFSALLDGGSRPHKGKGIQSKRRNPLTRLGETVFGRNGRHAPHLADESFKGLYLDGGFGVGKTHLLTSLWFSTPEPKAYMSFEELTAFIGFAGMTHAVETFKNHKLLCIDEFELDDVANTLMVVSLFRSLFDEGDSVRIATTSNTLPGSLGNQRFNASEFKREIATIASYFREIKIDGPDYRSDHESAPLPLREIATAGSRETVDDFDELLVHLTRVHPVHYRALFDGVNRVTINGLRTILEQDIALLFVQFIDKAYDANIPVQLNGCATEEVFFGRYRQGGYRKKYGRAESRINAMRRESSLQ